MHPKPQLAPSRLELLENLRRSVRPLESREGGDCEIWLVRWPTPTSKQLWWAEARSTGLNPVAGPFETEEDARAVDISATIK